MEINAIYEGDNLEVLSKFPDNSADLIYADPPFFSNKHYEVIWKDGAEIRAFEDRWKGGIENYIAWMEPRIREAHRVLKDTGSMYLHCDWHADAHLRILMDKIFGEKNFRNEIIWHYDYGARSKKTFGSKHDTIFWYSKSGEWTFNAKDVLEPFKSKMTEWRYTKGGQRGKPMPEGKIPSDVWGGYKIQRNGKRTFRIPNSKTRCTVRAYNKCILK